MIQNKSVYSFRVFLGVIVAGWFLTSCIGPDAPQKPKNLMPEDHYVDMLVDMQHIVTWRNVDPDSINADSLKQLIYQRYSVTEEQFEATHNYYQQQVERQLVRIDEVIRRLEGERDYIQSHIDSVKQLRATQDSLAADTLGDG